MLRVKVEPSGEDFWKLDPVIDLIKHGAVGVIPTDTVLKGIGDSKPLSILCHSLRDIDTYTIGFPQGTNQGQANIFRAVKHAIPGPYTFILPATKQFPKQCIKHGLSTRYAKRRQGLDFIVDGGVRIADPSTVVDMTGTYPTIIRQGKGPKLDWMVAEDKEHEAQSTLAFKEA
ncbi:uncharacterized protein LOC133899719 isoform X1 [Phragmites australis]|uniref:uncharacterized protein LOC133899719 isoform X1 n=1 Tax=Phragmites australis TaxID=29695 RepID=UPI002D79D3E2|nr:uncharacterized protein LOC133899719 isoform X1 [Phragmites australis]XP_062196747.1 uncharacterized protein LOC133899719 isoform X1 [Phragmites australis]